MEEELSTEEQIRRALMFDNDAYLLLSNIALQMNYSEEQFEKLSNAVMGDSLWESSFARVADMYTEEKMKEFLSHLVEYSEFLITLYEGVPEAVDAYLKENPPSTGAIH
jgi:hypothetical protein